MSKEEIEFVFKIINQILQDLFFLVGIVVTTLTYINARRTLLQPIKTEVFKLQLAKYSSILDIFTTKSKAELKKYFDKILFLNACSICDDYAELFFDIEFNRDERPYNTDKSKIITLIDVYSMQQMEEYKKYRATYNEYISIIKNRQKTHPEKQETKLDFWINYKYRESILTMEYIDFVDNLKTIIKSPLLPNELLELLEKFMETMQTNKNLVNETLNKCAKELPNKYFANEILKENSFMFVWIQTRYEENFEDLEPIAEKIINYIRNYWLVEKINNN